MPQTKTTTHDDTTPKTDALATTPSASRRTEAPARAQLQPLLCSPLIGADVQALLPARSRDDDGTGPRPVVRRQRQRESRHRAQGRGKRRFNPSSRHRG